MGPPGTPALAETGGFQEFIGWPATEQKQRDPSLKREKERDSTSCSSLHVCALTYVHTYKHTTWQNNKIKCYTYINTSK